MLAMEAQQAVAPILDRLNRYRPDTPARPALTSAGCAGHPLDRIPPRAPLGQLFSWQPCCTPADVEAADPLPADLLLVMAGARPMILLHGPEQQARRWLAWACRRGLTGLTSAVEFRPHSDASLGRYANLMDDRQPARYGSGAWRGVFIGPDPGWVVTAWLAEQRGWDSVLGACLGYPACCIDAFARRWPTAVRHYQGDPGLMLLAQTDTDPTIPWELNLFARYQGPSFTEHFPCHWHCPASIQRARWLSQVLAQVAPETEADIRHRMQQPVTVAGRTVTFSGLPVQSSLTEVSS